MFDHILVPLDGSSLAECVLPHAVAMAKAFDSRITLLRVLERPASSGGQIGSVDPLHWHIRKAEADAYVEAVAVRLQKAGLRAEKVILEGPAAERIIEFAQSREVGLLLLSSHGRSGLSGWNVSSIVQKIILRAYVPVMIVRAYEPSGSDLTGLRYRRVLVPLDYSRRAECVLPPVTTLARANGSVLLMTHVVTKPHMPRRAPPTEAEVELANQVVERNREEVAPYLEQLASRLGVDVETRLLVSDNVAATLHEMVEQEDVDLTVLSAHGYSGVTKWPYGGLVVSFIGYGTTPLLIVQDLSAAEIELTKAERLMKEQKGH